jgi:hypothetical protein
LLVGLERLGEDDNERGAASGQSIDASSEFVEKKVLLGEGAVGRCAQNGMPLAIRGRVQPGGGGRALVALVLPILWHDECVGVVQLTSRAALEAVAAYSVSTAASGLAASQQSLTQTPPLSVSLGRRVRFSDAPQEEPLGEEAGTPLLYGAEALQPLDTTRFHDDDMLAAPHEEGSVRLATALFAVALQAEPPLPLKACLMAAPVIFTASEVFHLHYSFKDLSQANAGDATSCATMGVSVHTDPSLADTLAQLHDSQRTAEQYRQQLIATEERATGMAHELEAACARTMALCEHRVAALTASRDKYRGRALALAREISEGSALGWEKENAATPSAARGKRS